MLSHRWALAGLIIFAAASNAAPQDLAPVPSTQITLPRAQQRWREAVSSAANDAATIARDWLGAHPSGAITEIAIDPPVWQGRGAMVVESQAAAAVIRSWWPDTLIDQNADVMLDGFAWYLQGHVIERLFDRRYRRTGHRAESIRLFGGDVVWSFPALRLSRWTAGRDREHNLADAHTARYAAVFASLERWLGEPALQGAMQEVARIRVDRISGSAIVSTISIATGQDLAWLFTAASDPDVTFDYAVTGMESGPGGSCPPPCFETRVSAARLGAGQFSGRSAARAGEFDSGDAIALRVTFANGDQAWARWDGRDHSRTFRFEGPAPATAARVDPQGVVVLDANRLNDAIMAPSPTNLPVRKWIARWIVWMQNTVLSYGFYA